MLGAETENQDVTEVLKFKKKKKPTSFEVLAQAVARVTVLLKL